MKIKTIGDLRKCIEELSDDYKIDFRIYDDKNIDVIYFDGIDFNDIGVSDKDFCISVTIESDNDHE